jgi:hypothetical protein
MKTPFVLCTSLVIYLFGQGINAATVTYDVESQFSTASNPNGVWTYGATTNLGSPLMVHGVSYNGMWAGWQIAPSAMPNIQKNVSGQTLGSGQAHFHLAPSSSLQGTARFRLVTESPDLQCRTMEAQTIIWKRPFILFWMAQHRATLTFMC